MELTPCQAMRAHINEGQTYLVFDLPGIIRLRGGDHEATVRELVRAISLQKLLPCKPIEGDDLSSAEVSGGALLRYLTAEEPACDYDVVAVDPA